MEENTVEKKSGGKGLGIIISLILICAAFAGGYFTNQFMNKDSGKSSSSEEKKEEKKEETKEDSTKEETKEDTANKESIPIMDNYIFSHGKLYIINDGNVYVYNGINDELTKKYGYDVYNLTHSGCIYDSSTDYCKGNPGYSIKATKIDGLSNVVKLKLYNRVGASDESFTVYAITEDGNVYSISTYNDSVSEFLADKNVKDMLAQNGDSYEILLKDGKHMIYKWSPDESDTNLVGKYKITYEEKK